MFKIIKGILPLLGCIMLLHSLAGYGATVYVYVNQAGNRLITDHLRTNLSGYKLVKSYGVDDYFGSPNRPASVTPTPIASRYDRLIFSKADQLGLEPALLKAMVHVESAFDADALSPKGALGLMQLMPDTASRYGVAAREDPVESLDGGSRYICDLLALFGQDIRLALAAYNAGENAVLKYNGIPPYTETQNYVDKVIQLRDRYRNNLAGV